MKTACCATAPVRSEHTLVAHGAPWIGGLVGDSAFARTPRAAPVCAALLQYRTGHAHDDAAVGLVHLDKTGAVRCRTMYAKTAAANRRHCGRIVEFVGSEERRDSLRRIQNFEDFQESMRVALA